MKTKGIFKKVVSLVMAVAVVASLGCTAFAADINTAGSNGSSEVLLTIESDATFSVTVPMSLPVSVDADGNVTVATDAVIINNSHGQVQVTNAEINGANDWAIVDYTTDMSKEKVGAKKLGFTLNNDVTGEDGTLSFTQTNFPVLDGANDTDSDELALTYNAVVPAQKSVVSDSKIAEIVFTVGWYEAE